MRPPLVLSNEILHFAEQTAEELGISPKLHPDDELLRYIIAINGEENGTKQYLSGGHKSAYRIKSVIKNLFGDKKEIKVLEFASGYGRVTRHITKIMETKNYIASDIHPEACIFIEKEFGVKSIISSHEPEGLSVENNFEFIFVLSLFSHLPDKSFGRWLKTLYDRLSTGGFLLITANGQVTMRKRAEFWDKLFDRDSGYGFAKQSDQLDIDADEYGSMVVSLSYMARQIRDYVPGALLHSFTAGCWFGQQDEWILQKK